MQILIERKAPVSSSLEHARFYSGHKRLVLELTLTWTPTKLINSDKLRAFWNRSTKYQTPKYQMQIWKNTEKYNWGFSLCETWRSFRYQVLPCVRFTPKSQESFLSRLRAKNLLVEAVRSFRYTFTLSEIKKVSTSTGFCKNETITHCTDVSLGGLACSGRSASSIPAPCTAAIVINTTP